MARNPYTNADTASGEESREDAYAALGPRDPYAVPTLTDAPYVDSPGDEWAPSPRGPFGPGLDAHRLGSLRQHDMRPDPVRPPEEFYGRQDRDTAYRHSVEDIDADGWAELKGGSGKRVAPHPESIRPPEPRLTSVMAPRSYSFTRPWARVQPLNGEHFSMADHKREYEILGMEPIHQRRNTYRLEPLPWDRDLMDVPPDVDTGIQGRVRAIDIPPSASRAYRLGG